MTDILDEILNDEKDTKRITLFRKIFPIIVTLTVIIAFIMAGYSWISAKNIRENQEIGDLFVQLLSGEYNDKKLINDLLEEIKEGRENKISELSALKLAGDQIKNNNTIEALKSLENIADNKVMSEITKSYAKILYVNLILDMNDVNAEQENKTREYLQSFSKDTQVFYATATLLKSLFYLKNQQFDLAKKYSMEILDLPRASLVIKDQARAVIENLKYEKK